MKEAPNISIVSPVYGAENIVEELVNRIEEEVSKVSDSYEIILVEDASPDRSWEVIQKVCSGNERVKGVKLSKNFGQHNAIRSGIDLATGDVCIVMDCDLQDNPIYIKDLVSKWQEGNDIVYTVKQRRRHSVFKNIAATIFNKVFNYFASEVNSYNNVGSYSLISRKVMNAFKQYKDYQIHYLLVLRWLGFTSDHVQIEHSDRYEGTSSYTIKKLFDHAMVGIIYQSDKLLKISIYLGFVISILSILSILLVVILYFYSGFQSGWASLFVMISFFAGIILIAIGVLGLYIGKLFEQVKDRPKYLIDQKLNF